MSDGSRIEGVVKFYNSDKGFGFLSKMDKKDIFFHISQWQGNDEPQSDERVTFVEGQGDRGPVAEDITLIN